MAESLQLTTCPGCGAPVDCGHRNGRATCWCASYPKVVAVPCDPAAACYCEECLRRMIPSETSGAVHRET